MLKLYESYAFSSSNVMRGFRETYIKPYCRAAPWLTGIYLGYEVATKNRKLNRVLTVIIDRKFEFINVPLLII